jgi:hypothetical protein
MKNSSFSPKPLSLLSPESLTRLAEGTEPSHAPVKNTEKIVEEVVFEVEFVNVFTDSAVGRVWFLGTERQGKVIQGEGIVVIPILPDMCGNGFAMQGNVASVVANTYGEFGDIKAVVQGVLEVESISVDDTPIKTGFGRVKVSDISSDSDTIRNLNKSAERARLLH